MIYLTNGLHVAVRLFSNRSQMTSKCGKNKKVKEAFISNFATLADKKIAVCRDLMSIQNEAN